jgi:hypothetical protein
MIIKYPLSESKRARIMEKSKQAMARRMLIKKRTGPEVEQANRWWALWMSALGVRKIEFESRGQMPLNINIDPETGEIK